MLGSTLYSEQKSHAIYLLQQGRLAEAVHEFQTLLKQEPNDPQCLHLLGETFSLLGEQDMAERYFRRLVSLYPATGLSHYILGKFLGMQNKLLEAYLHLNKACELTPQNLDAGVKAGLVSLLAGKHKQAITHFEQVLAKNSEHSEATVRLGDAFAELGELDRAVTCYSKALTNNSSDPNAVAGLATIHILKMEIDTAHELIQPVLGQNDLRINLIQAEIFEKQKKPDLAIKILNNSLDSLKVAASDEANIRFKLGKIYDKCQNYDLAFTAFREANSLINASYNPSSVEKELANYMTYNAPFLNSITLPRPHASAITPVFIIGMPRSGTSLTEQILASHSKVFGGGELQFIQETLSSLSKRRPSNEHYLTCLQSFPTDELLSIAKEHLEKLVHLKDKNNCDISFVTDKMPNNFWHLGLIQTLFPNAKIIHCVRNPLDTCLSCFFQNFSGAHPYSNKLENLGHYYNIYTKLMEHWESVLTLKIFEIKYENLVNNFESTCKDLISFCELPWEDDCLHFYKSKRAVTTSSYDQVRNPIHQTSVERWRHYEPYIGPLLHSLNIDH